MSASVCEKHGPLCPILHPLKPPPPMRYRPLDSSKANETLKHVYGHANRCLCDQPDRERAMKARLAARFGVLTRNHVVYDPEKYKPIEENQIERLVCDRNPFFALLRRHA